MFGEYVSLLVLLFLVFELRQTINRFCLLSVDLLTFECLGSSSYFCLVWFSILYLISYLCRVVLPS